MSTCSDLQKSGQWASCFQAKVLSDWVGPAAEKSCDQSFQYPYQVELNRKWEEKRKKNKNMVLSSKKYVNLDYD